MQNESAWSSLPCTGSRSQVKRRNRKAVLLSGCPLSLRIEQDLLPYSIGHLNQGMRVNKELDREGLGATFPSGIPTGLGEV